MNSAMNASNTQPSEIVTEFRDDGRVAIVTINRPHRRNACDLAAWTDLRDRFRAFAAERGALQLVVLTGAGGHFCAGTTSSRSAACCPIRWPRTPTAR